MIFATVGTHHDGFPRMLSALEAITEEDVVVQHGHGLPPRNATLARPFMPFEQMMHHFRAARVVVTHAGVGSVLLAVEAGHVPIVVPRRHSLREHVDDHQVDLAAALERKGRVVAIWDTAQLADAVRSVMPRSASVDLARAELCSAVRAALTRPQDPRPYWRTRSARRGPALDRSSG